MSHTVNIKQFDQPLVVPEGETILEAALEAGLDYPFGCQSGACGSCKSILLSGEVELREYQPFVLSDEEIEAGYTLACQAECKTDVEIAYMDPDEPANHLHRSLDTVVESVEQVTHDIKVVRITIPGGLDYQFTPGQFSQVTFEGLPGRDYSMANQPGESVVEFHIREVPDGNVSRHVANNLAVGDKVSVKGPYGVSYLRTKHRGPIIAAGGGSGLAPIKSIVEKALAENLPQPIHFYFGVRDEEDLYLEDHFNALAEKHENFTFTPVLSNPTGETSRRTGFVHDVLNADFDDFDGCKAYLAGPPIMVDSCVEIVCKKGLRIEDVHADPFTTEADKAK